MEISFKNGKIHFESQVHIINLPKFCLHLTTDNNETLAQLFTCDEQSSGDIEKQLHKSLVRVIGETNCSYLRLLLTDLVFRHLNITATSHHNAVCSLALEAISNKPRKMSHVSHHQLGSAVFLPYS